MQAALPVSFNEGEPYRVPSTETLDANQIAVLAANQSLLAKLLCQEAANLQTFAKPKHGSKGKNGLPSRFLSMLSARESQRSAEQAVRIHYGLRAAIEGMQVVNELLEELQLANEAERMAIAKGIPIFDPTKLQQLRLQATDEKTQIEEKIIVLRNQLSLLIPKHIACRYQPATTETPSDVGIDACEDIRFGIENRCDLQALRLLSSELSESDLEWTPWALSRFSGVPPIASPASAVWFKRIFRSPEIQNRLDARRKQISQAAVMTEHKIGAEIQISWTELRTAITRRDLALQSLNLWKTRVDQLDAMAELGKPMPTERLEAKLKWIAQKGILIERTNDILQALAVHQCNVGQLPGQ